MIGIYGGTFDPIHLGHLRTALEVKQALALDELRFLPCGLPAHKDRPNTKPAMRLKMLELALQDSAPGFSIDAREIERPGPSYMVDTLIAIRHEIGDESLCLILGQDAFAQLPSWHRWREIFDLAHLIVMRRPGAESFEFCQQLSDEIQDKCIETADALRLKPSGWVYFLEVTQLAISATEIRAMLQASKSPRYLLPDAVLDFIQAERLYLSPNDVSTRSEGA